MQEAKQEQKLKVYLAGKISGDPYYRLKFLEAARELEEAGHIVVNPAMLPPGLDYEAYMRIGKSMQAEADVTCFLSDWAESEGAIREYGQAGALGQGVIFFDEWKGFGFRPFTVGTLYADDAIFTKRVFRDAPQVADSAGPGAGGGGGSDAARGVSHGEAWGGPKQVADDARG